MIHFIIQEKLGWAGLSDTERAARAARLGAASRRGKRRVRLQRAQADPGLVPVISERVQVPRRSKLASVGPIAVNQWPGGARKVQCLRCPAEFVSPGKHVRLCNVCRDAVSGLVSSSIMPAYQDEDFG